MTIKKIGLYLSMATVLGLGSCKSFFEDTNKDPEATEIATPKVLLPTIELNIAFSMGGDAARYSSIMTQHYEGRDRQFLGYQNYSWVPDDFSTLWSNIYSGSLKDLKLMRAAADAEGNTAYGGIGCALEAYLLLQATDLFGDIPYSDAFKADEGNLSPKYDSQQDVYKSVGVLLDSARAKFARPSRGASPSSTDDFIYNGSIAKWGKFVNVLAARLALHQSKVDNTAYAKVRAELAKGSFASNDDDAVLAWGPDGSLTAGPMAQYNGDRYDAEINPVYTSLLEKMKDPRVVPFGGRDITAGDTSYSILNSVLIYGNERTFLMSYAEQKFMEAEANLASNAVAARAAYLAGIKSSFGTAGLSDSLYNVYVAQTAVNPATLTVKDVITQKYIALFLQTEVLIDLRRSNNVMGLAPNTKPTSGLPNRFLYPQRELDLNPNSKKGLTIYSKVWSQGN